MRRAQELYEQGNSLLGAGDAEGAAASFLQAVAEDPEFAKAWNNLGVARQTLGHDRLALDAYQAAVARDGSLAQAFLNLGRISSDLREYETAARALERAVEIEPDNAQAWGALGHARRELGRSDAAKHAFQRAIECDPAYSFPYQSLGYMALGEGDWPEFEKRLATAHALNPSDPSIVHMLATARRETPTAPPAGQVEDLFDKMAGHFDAHLVGELGYRMPELIAGAVQPVLASRPAPRVFDFGCGTGLVGAALAGAGAHLVGADLSSRMLALARERGGYAELVHGDATAALLALAPASLDAVLSADAFIYVGDLNPVFAAAARALRPGGAFAFSLEVQDSEGYRLTSSGRYAHSAGYARSLARAHGLVEERMERVPLRREGDRFTDGWLCCFRNGG